ncbi:hypothetical protein FH972_017239 [Carpinus fangiana]|uniref:Late embryogenesis abundant protein LEA-2 subgroup domain-containing protein n=1 Tax=Carpinus fangiana TaxID=176857 RepID=A0A5N6RID1_9ROSI|nr:hypothetical protein FH972_017239 [Carpinus fangiana]
MEEKQTHLNGAHHRHRHRPSLISKIVVIVLAVIGPSVFVVLLILTPKSFKIHVTDAFLAQFNLTTNNYTLHYNLALNISIRNSNKRIGFYYDTIHANGYYYYPYRFGAVSLTPFYQGHKNTSVLSPVFHGRQRLYFLESSELIPKFNNDTSDGVYRIAVELYLSFRTKGERWIKNGHFNPVINCDLKVPLSSNGKSAARFETTECELDS